ncbi:hypothetical protein BKA70DRAFT_1229620 [Coprinopsis sp. MPI-PUGE-AT-0042]|nr:hypothetical protein BKA70DRAFT_1229620 [Coprinopsis sp. MPI-PUGE-AT-0042]
MASSIRLLTREGVAIGIRPSVDCESVRSLDNIPIACGTSEEVMSPEYAFYAREAALTDSVGQSSSLSLVGLCGRRFVRGRLLQLGKWDSRAAQQWKPEQALRGLLSAEHVAVRASLNRRYVYPVRGSALEVDIGPPEHQQWPVGAGSMPVHPILRTPGRQDIGNKRNVVIQSTKTETLTGHKAYSSVVYSGDPKTDRAGGCAGGGGLELRGEVVVGRCRRAERRMESQDELRAIEPRCL